MMRRVLFYGRIHAQRNSIPSIRLFSSASSNNNAADNKEAPSSVAENELDQILAKEGNKKLYYTSQAMTIRTMLVVAGVNFMVIASCLSVLLSNIC